MLQMTVKSRFFEPPRETGIGSRNREVSWGKIHRIGTRHITAFTYTTTHTHAHTTQTDLLKIHVLPNSRFYCFYVSMEIMSFLKYFIHHIKLRSRTNICC